MDHDPFPNLEQVILALLQKQARDYLTVKQLVTGLPAATRKQLALRGAQPTSTLVHKLTPHLGKAVQVYKGGRGTYIGRSLPVTELILQRLRQKPGVSSRQLGSQLPLGKTAYLTALNGLLQSGAVVCCLQEDHTLRLRVAASPQPLAAAAPAIQPDDRYAFKAAYDSVGQGRSFVRIHRLREALAWPRERFDGVLQELRAAYTVELHGGDPALLTGHDLENSFLDHNGILYITLSWRGAL